jgi:hypothetical protein
MRASATLSVPDPLRYAPIAEEVDMNILILGGGGREHAAGLGRPAEPQMRPADRRAGQCRDRANRGMRGLDISTMRRGLEFCSAENSRFLS